MIDIYQYSSYEGLIHRQALRETEYYYIVPDNDRWKKRKEARELKADYYLTAKGAVEAFIQRMERNLKHYQNKVSETEADLHKAQGKLRELDNL